MRFNLCRGELDEDDGVGDLTLFNLAFDIIPEMTVGCAAMASSVCRRWKSFHLLGVESSSEENQTQRPRSLSL